VRLAWDIEIYELDQQHWWSSRVDSVTGDVISEQDYVIHENFVTADTHGTLPAGNLKQENETESPAPIALAPNDYLVYEWPRESPLHNPQGPLGSPIEGRTVQNAPWNDAAPSPLPSPFTWHDTNGSPGVEFTVTRGNNVNAYEDGNNPGFQPDCGLSLDCNTSPLFHVDLLQHPDTYEAAAISNLFYWNNIVHDMTHLYGFDEVWGNFQENNYGNGGLGSDFVNAEAQDGSSICNANFATPPDGQNPTMQMFLCDDVTPLRDGDFDNGVIIHEYGHGISNRLTGGPGSVSCLNNDEQMGEGWSDWLMLMMTIEAGDLGSDSRTIATYLVGQPPDGPGIRPTPYSTNFAVNPTTYGDLGEMVIPHGVGYVWATMLWDLNWELIAKGSQTGLDPDIFNGAGGNNLMTQLVMDGMKLQPCSPGFVDGRDAILQADQNLTGGQNQCLIWDAFARRGLGFTASQGSSNSTTDGTEAFNLPPACLQTLKINKSTDPDPVNAGANLKYTLVATNDTAGTLIGVVVEDTIQAHQNYVPNSVTCGGSESGGVVTFPLGTMPPGHLVTCTFQVTVDSAIGSTEFFFDDFESGLDNWTTDGLWHAENESDTCGSQQAPFPSSANAAYFGQDDSCDYNTGSPEFGSLAMNSSVHLPADSTPVLNFSYFLQTEQTDGFDQAYVEISNDGGFNWHLLTQLSDSAWQQKSVDLSAYTGSGVRVRFRFDTVDNVANNFFGLLVDDVQIIDEVTVSNTACVTANEGDNACASVMTLVLANAVEPAALSIDPANAQIPFDDTATVDVVVDDSSSIFAAELELHFDPAIVEVVNVLPGTCPAPDSLTQNEWDNVNGTINYAATSIPPTTPCDDGTVMQITFRGLVVEGVSQLDFASSLLSDINSVEIPAITQNGTLEVVEIIGSIEGTVDLQGRSDDNGAEVCADDGTNRLCVLTDSDGNYAIDLPQGSHDVTVEIARYLDAEKLSVPVVAANGTSLPPLTLLGGDTNDDCTVNILDLSLEGGRFRSTCDDPNWDPRADINNDCTVNILDLSVSGGNFGLSCPVPWS
jgi:uncharacterized repeat protein (TIGR01451 family)